MGGGMGGGSNKTKKIFVGGLSASTDEERLKKFMTDFGKVEEVLLMYDRETQRPRGFGFVTFDAEEAVDRLVEMHRVGAWLCSARGGGSHSREEAGVCVCVARVLPLLGITRDGPRDPCAS